MEIMDALSGIIYYDGITSMEALCRLLIMFISLEFLSSITYSIFKGVR